MLKKLKNSKKGFTLAELLIVVAIIGVLVAVSIPIFTAQLRKARLATNQANARAAYAEVVANQLDKGYAGATGTYNVSTAGAGMSVTLVSGSITATTPIQNWSVGTTLTGSGAVSGALGDIQVTAWKVSIDKNGHVAVVPTAKKS